MKLRAAQAELFSRSIQMIPRSADIFRQLLYASKTTTHKVTLGFQYWSLLLNQLTAWMRGWSNYDLLMMAMIGIGYFNTLSWWGTHGHLPLAYLIFHWNISAKKWKRKRHVECYPSTILRNLAKYVIKLYLLHTVIVFRLVVGGTPIWRHVISHIKSKCKVPIYDFR